MTTPNPDSTTSSETYTTNTPDPWRKFLENYISQTIKSGSGQIPEQTMKALQNFTANPVASAEFFPKLAQPLLEANHVSQDRQLDMYNDEIRKAGGTANGVMQSGAYAQGLRSLAGDFGRQDQEILAKNYVPLTSQISENQINAIKAGLSVPSATADTYKSIAPLITQLNPLATRVQQTGVNQNIVPAPPEGQYINNSYSPRGYGNYPSLATDPTTPYYSQATSRY